MREPNFYDAPCCGKEFPYAIGMGLARAAGQLFIRIRPHGCIGVFSDVRNIAPRPVNQRQQSRFLEISNLHRTRVVGARPAKKNSDREINPNYGYETKNFVERIRTQRGLQSPAPAGRNAETF